MSTITAGNLGRKSGAILLPKVESGGLVEPAPLCLLQKGVLFSFLHSRPTICGFFDFSGVRHGDGFGVVLHFLADMGDSTTFLPLSEFFYSKSAVRFVLCCVRLLLPPLREVEWLFGDDLLRCLLLRSSLWKVIVS